MRICALCFILLLLVGCDTLGGRSVVLKLKPQGQPIDTSVEQALSVVDEVMAREGIRRVAASSDENGRVASYVGGQFICNVSVRDSKLIVGFLNPHFGGGPPDSAVTRVSDTVAESLRNHYGTKQVSTKN